MRTRLKTASPPVATKVMKSRSGRTRLLRTGVRLLGKDSAVRAALSKRGVEDADDAPPVIGGKGARQRSNALSMDEVLNLFRTAGALMPPVDPKDYSELYEETTTLRPNVDAYVTNIDGHGHHFKPVIDLNGDDAFDKVYDAMYLERVLEQEEGKVLKSGLEPTDAEVDARIEELARDMRVEHFRVQAFFESCTVEESFNSLRMRTRQEREVTGNGYWEVLRSGAGKEVQFNYLPSNTMRLMPLDGTTVSTRMTIRTTPLRLGTETVERRFRRFLQVTETGRQCYFKEYGDPRTLSSNTGKFYDTPEDFRRAERKAVAATEVVHWKIPSPSTSYGVPRWAGAYLAVLGTAKADEVNFLYFDNKAIPPLALLVSGGRVTESTVEKLEEFIEDNLKGTDNFHRILIIEAESPGTGDGENNGRLKIELKPLTDAQQKEGLFMKYEERNTDRVGMMFRLPRLLRGDSRDFNRATAQAALKFTDSQVFGPERHEFDHFMNRILSALGIRYWKFVSNGVQITNAEDMASIIADLAKAGVLWPALALELLGEYVFNRDMPLPDADWAFQPVILTQTGMKADTARDGEIPREEGAAPAQAGAGAGGGEARAGAKKRLVPRGVAKALGRRRSDVDMKAMAREIIHLRKELANAEGAAALEDFKAERVEDMAEVEKSKVPALEPRIIKMPAAVMAEKFGILPIEAR